MNGIRKIVAWRTLMGCAAASLALSAGPGRAGVPMSGWGYTGGGPGNARYSPLTQINKKNLDKLKVAWVAYTGMGRGFTSAGEAGKYTFEATPILVEGTLFMSTGFGHVLAINAASGKILWNHDVGLDKKIAYSSLVNRGVAAWTDPKTSPDAPCHLTIFVGTMDGRLVALDGATGKLCKSFGDGGQIALWKKSRPVLSQPGNYEITSPPMVVGDAVIVDSDIGDNRGVRLEWGTVRAFDARSGKIRWAWNPIPQNPAQAKELGWQPKQAKATGAGNAWAPMAADPKHGLVFIGTGSASPDYYGGERLGKNLYADSLVAINVSTGKLVWHHQLVHHDLWDYDLSSPPMLVSLKRHGKTIPAVIQVTKTGMVYVFNRLTGKPLFPIEEHPVPASDVPGEKAWPTQPFSSLPALVPQHALTAKDAWGLTFWDKGKCRDKIKQYRSEGIFTPPSQQGTIEYPGYAGGAEWGGGAWDPARQWFIINTNNIAMVTKLIPRKDFEKAAHSDQYKGWECTAQRGTPYGMCRTMISSPVGAPCNAPPWGTLTALDMTTGKIAWQVPLGTSRDTAPWPLWWFHWGMPNLGGPLLTASGLVFIAAAADDYLRAFDVKTGKVLWKARLPAGGQAGPMTYALDGKQYIVIAAGGHGGLKTKRGDSLIAYTLQP